jgi:hypothetical protein
MTLSGLVKGELFYVSVCSAASISCAGLEFDYIICFVTAR